MTSKESLLLQYDLIVVPDPTLAKYLVEAYHDKEVKVAKKKQYYDKLVKQPWGVIGAYPPKERMEWEKIKSLSKQKWVRKYPPLAVVGDDTYKRLKNHAQVEYFGKGVEDFALYLPPEIVPSKRVLVLRYKNRFDTLVQSLVLRGITVTSAYPISWTKKEWNSQEERMARECDVIYFHDPYAVREWAERLGPSATKKASGGPFNKANELAENLIEAAKQVNPMGPSVPSSDIAGVVDTAASQAAVAGQADNTQSKSAQEPKLGPVEGSKSSNEIKAAVKAAAQCIPAACHDIEVAKIAKAVGFKDVFYAKEPNTDGLYKTVMQAVQCAKQNAIAAEAASKK